MSAIAIAVVRSKRKKNKSSDICYWNESLPMTESFIISRTISSRYEKYSIRIKTDKQLLKSNKQCIKQTFALLRDFQLVLREERKKGNRMEQVCVSVFFFFFEI